MQTTDTPAGDSPGRGKNGQFTRSVDTVERDSLAARLRARGTSYRVIAEKLRYSNESGAYKAVQRALAAVPVEDVGELRALESARLDELAERLWGVLNVKYPHEVAGRMVVDQDDKPIGDPAIVIAAVDRLMRISQQRAKLLGLNVPPVESKPAAGELTGQQVAMLQRLLQALPVEAAQLPALLALPMGAETPGAAA
jgi:hypothetical protein